MAGAWYRLPSGQLFHVSGHRHVEPSRSVPVDVVVGEQGVEVVEGAEAPPADVAVTDEVAQLDEVVTIEGDAPTVDEAG